MYRTKYYFLAKGYDETHERQFLHFHIYAQVERNSICKDENYDMSEVSSALKVNLNFTRISLF